MTKWLASVQSLDEAKALTSCLPDILDLKNPATGALGALPLSTVSTVVDWLDGRCLSSATVGDLPMQAELIHQAVVAMAETGVDYVKVGLFADPQLTACLNDLAPLLRGMKTPVIAVLFADEAVGLDLLPVIQQAGFSGVMVDTATKTGQGVLSHWDEKRLCDFISQARQLKLLCGLAGSLRIEDIDSLEPLGADYLGFRSALCDQQQRTRGLLAAQARSVQQRLHQFGMAS
jgi:uncharacterized protein (UPF0264 family)